LIYYYFRAGTTALKPGTERAQEYMRKYIHCMTTNIDTQKTDNKDSSHQVADSTNSKLIVKIKMVNRDNVGRDNVVLIAAGYRLDGPQIESQGRRDFPHPSRQVLEPTQPAVHWVPGIFPGRKVAGVWSLPPTPIRCRG
jgi:hypothetical protein